MKTGIVLAGGSLKGMYNHTGFLLALKNLGIKIDAVIGTSAGSISGGYIAAGGSPEKLREILIDLRADDYIDKISTWKLGWKLFKKLRGVSGLIKGEALQKYIEKKFPVRTFEETPIPFYAHTVNISRVREEIFHSGELAPAIRASASIPYIFALAPIKDSNGVINYYWDGGVVGYNALEELAEREGKEIKSDEFNRSVMALAKANPQLDTIIVNDFHRHNTDIDNSFMEKDWTPYHLGNKLLDCVAGEFDRLKYQVLKQYDIEVISIRPNIPFNVNLEKPSPELAKKVIQYSIEETYRCFRDLGKVQTKAGKNLNV